MILSCEPQRGKRTTALLCVAMLMIAVWIAAVRHSYPRSERWPTLGELVKSFIPAAPALATPFLLVGGMLSGSFTPTEASTSWPPVAS